MFTQTAGTASSGYTAMSEDVGMLQFAYTVHGDVFVSRVPTRMVYLYYILCLRYTFLAGNPRFVCLFFFFSVLFCFSFSWECIVFLSHILASSSSSVFPAMSLGFTILGEIFAYVAVF